MVPYLHQFSALVHKMHQNLNIYAGTAPSEGAIWERFSEQHQHQNIKKSTIVIAR